VFVFKFIVILFY